MGDKKLIVFSAPSGGGKTTVVKHILKLFPDVKFSVSACTRPRRKGEKEAVDYYFLSQEEFEQKIKRDEFLEYEEVYPGKYYGTLKKEVERIWSKGSHVIFDIDVMGALRIKSKFPGKTLTIFVKPPSFEILKQRLYKRGTDTDTVLKERISRAHMELKYEEKFDVTIINDELSETLSKAQKVVEKFIKSEVGSERS